MSGPGEVKLSDEQIKAAITWFGHGIGFNRQAEMTLYHTRMDENGKNRLTDLDEKPIYTSNIIINKTLNFFYPGWRGAFLDAKIAILKDLMSYSCY